MILVAINFIGFSLQLFSGALAALSFAEVCLIGILLICRAEGTRAQVLVVAVAVLFLAIITPIITSYTFFSAAIAYALSGHNAALLNARSNSNPISVFNHFQFIFGSACKSRYEKLKTCAPKFTILRCTSHCITLLTFCPAQCPC